MPTDAWGIDDGYEDALGVWRPLSESSRAAIREAMGDGPSPGPAPVRVVRAGETAPVAGRFEVALEDGTVRAGRGALPADLPLGYHRLTAADRGPDTTLIVGPGRCHLPATLRAWGWAAQLYAARSGASWGIGDLADLRRLARWSASELGARLLLINPLLAPAPVLPQEASPYFPSSRLFRNPLYLRIEEVPGAAALGAELEPLAAAGRRLNAGPRIDRDAVFRLKMPALERLWSVFPGDAAFDAYRAEQGAALEDFATFCVLAERHGRGWQGWPEPYHRPGAPAVARLRRDAADRIRFHAWLQWLLDAQLRAASTDLRVMHDLPIGVDAGGADAWAWQDVITTGASVGAPPDRYIRRGQDWGLPPFVPHRLRARGYAPFVATIRASLRHAGGLRIDHVMGLFRLFWIPRGLPPAQGGFVRYPADDLLAILALESHRAQAIVVGEDLGTVERGVRERLAAHRILAYRVLWFETDPPASYPELALATVTTHDLPTLAGLWSGADIRAQREIGLEPNEEALGEVRARLGALTGLAPGAAIDQVIETTYQRLAAAPSIAVTATLDDALAVEERPNMPSTTTQWPNWSLALPVPLEALEREPLPRRIAAALDRLPAPAGPPAPGGGACGSS